MDTDTLLQTLKELLSNSNLREVTVIEAFSHLITTPPHLTSENIEALQDSKKRMCEKNQWEIEFHLVDGIHLTSITHPTSEGLFSSSSNVRELQLLHTNKRSTQNYYKFGYLVVGDRLLMCHENRGVPVLSRDVHRMFEQYSQILHSTDLDLQKIHPFIIYY